MSNSIPDVKKMSGLEVLHATVSGELPAPPAHQLLGISGGTFEPGVASFSLTPRIDHYNPMGVVHGGVISALLDSAMGCAVYSTLAAGIGYTTIDLHVTFVRAATIASGTLRAEGRSIHSGGRIATAEGRIIDAAGKLIAHATETCLILS